MTTEANRKRIANLKFDSESQRERVAMSLAKKRAAHPSMAIPVTEKQRRLITLLADDNLSLVAAARRAGYVSKNAAKTALARPQVAHALAMRRAEVARDLKMSREKVLEGIMEAIEMAKIKAEPMTMISGWREIGRMCGFYEPTKTKVELSLNTDSILTQMSSMSDDELLKLTEASGNMLETLEESGVFTVIMENEVDDEEDEEDEPAPEPASKTANTGRKAGSGSKNTGRKDTGKTKAAAVHKNDTPKLRGRVGARGRVPKA